MSSRSYVLLEPQSMAMEAQPGFCSDAGWVLDRPGRHSGCVMRPLGCALSNGGPDA